MLLCSPIAHAADDGGEHQDWNVAVPSWDQFWAGIGSHSQHRAWEPPALIAAALKASPSTLLWAEQPGQEDVRLSTVQ